MLSKTVKRTLIIIVAALLVGCGSQKQDNVAEAAAELCPAGNFGITCSLCH